MAQVAPHARAATVLGDELHAGYGENSGSQAATPKIDGFGVAHSANHRPARESNRARLEAGLAATRRRDRAEHRDQDGPNAHHTNPAAQRSCQPIERAFGQADVSSERKSVSLRSPRSPSTICPAS